MMETQKASGLVMRQYSENLVVVVVACFLFVTGVLARICGASLAGSPPRRRWCRSMEQESTSKEKVEPSMPPQALTDNLKFKLVQGWAISLLVDANHDKFRYASRLTSHLPRRLSFRFRPRKVSL